MPFIENLIELRNGGAAIELTEGLEAVVKAVRETGKAGALTLKLSVLPADKGPDIDTVFIQDAITVNAPKPDKKKTLFFANIDNHLSRNDQRQLEMLDGLRESASTSQEVR